MIAGPACGLVGGSGPAWSTSRCAIPGLSPTGTWRCRLRLRLWTVVASRPSCEETHGLLVCGTGIRLSPCAASAEPVGLLTMRRLRRSVRPVRLSYEDSIQTVRRQGQGTRSSPVRHHLIQTETPTVENAAGRHSNPQMIFAQSP